MKLIASRLFQKYISAVHWFIPSAVRRDTALLMRAENLVHAAVLAALCGPFYAWSYHLLGATSASSASSAILLCCALIAAVPFLLRATANIVIARETFLALIFINFSWLTAHLGGVDAPTAAWLITAPVAAMFLGGAISASFWLLMSCGTIMAIYFLPHLFAPTPEFTLNNLRLMHLICNLLLYAVVVVFVLLFELAKTQGFIKLEQALTVINELAIRDELTGSHNRRHLMKLIEEERYRAGRSGNLFCLCLLDLDFFKNVNDTYGHSAGDTILREFARTVQAEIRARDCFGRYGGEEFLLMLPETMLEEALGLAEQVRLRIQQLAFPDISEDLHLTVSIGLAEYRAGESIGQTIARADEALYAAKSSGRDRSFCYGQQPVAALAGAASPATFAPALRAFAAEHSDPLTGVLNRRMLRDRLGHAMDRALRNNHLVALMLLNLNKFKEINDAVGYEEGDAILVQTAAIVRDCLRESDTIARWGGDEFVVILEEVAHESDAQKVADKIIRQFARPIGAAGRETLVTLSVGIALSPGVKGDVDTMLKRADIAMARAKSWGDNIVETHFAESPLPSGEGLALKNGLREAIRAGQLFLEYQPQIDLATQRLVGVEALIRWHHPEYGRIEPSRFIPLAEETGMIVPIGEWVLRTACEQNRAWCEAGLPSIKTAVNLSARQLKQPDLVERVLEIVEQTGIAPHCLDLEITEGILIDNLELNQGTLMQLRAAGVQISIDDFGTGYSSLNYLSELPADILKLDGSFVRRLAQPGSQVRPQAVVASIIGMAHRLGMKVIAESVENEDQLKQLGEMACDEAQGYFFSRPVNPARISELLLQQEPHGDVVAVL
jgi:diguanylate cyclase (GGDEF)-like protein